MGHTKHSMNLWLTSIYLKRKLSLERIQVLLQTAPTNPMVFLPVDKLPKEPSFHAFEMILLPLSLLREALLQSIAGGIYYILVSFFLKGVCFITKGLSCKYLIVLSAINNFSLENIEIMSGSSVVFGRSCILLLIYVV